MAAEGFSMDCFSLEGKVAIITGANQGLGLGYAKAYATAGADLYIPHFTDDITEVKEFAESKGRRIEFLQGDLCDRSYIYRIVADCLEKYGRIDILVNNAGASYFGAYDEYPDEKYDMVMNVNLNAPYVLAHEVGKVMKEQRSGKIINIGSALSFTADKHCPPYVLAKHGMIGLTRWLCNELGQYNVQANAVCPGFLATEVNSALFDNDPALRDKVTSRIAAGRWGVADDVAGTMVFLASKASDYINGWYISVDGGFTTVI